MKWFTHENARQHQANTNVSTLFGLIENHVKMCSNSLSYLDLKASNRFA